MRSNKNDNNFYFLALKYGVDNIEKGITFNQLLGHLKSNSITINDNLKSYFRYWFYENFYVKDVYETYKSTNTIERKSGLSDTYLVGQDDKLAIITGEAHQVYSDLMELKFAYKSSRQATKIAIASIIVAIIVGLSQIIIGIKQQSNNPIPNIKQTYNGCKK